MRLALIIAALANFGLAVLLVAVSGFILQGVNNQGPMLPEAIFLVVMIGLCLTTPVVARLLRARQVNPLAVLAVAYSPLAIAIVVLFSEPLFV